MRLPVALPLLLLFTVACTAAPAQRGHPLRSSNRVLAGADLTHPNAFNALDLILLRRPEFLRPGGPAGQGTPDLYIDDSVASVEQLRLMPTELVIEIRFLTAPEATFRFGLGHSNGAIVVRTSRSLLPAAI